MSAYLPQRGRYADFHSAYPPKLECYAELNWHNIPNRYVRPTETMHKILHQGIMPNGPLFYYLFPHHCHWSANAAKRPPQRAPAWVMCAIAPSGYNQIKPSSNRLKHLRPMHTNTATPTRSQSLPAADLRTFRQPNLQDIPPDLVPTVLTMRELFGAQLPADISYQAAPVSDPALRPMVFRTNYDEGYCGHFSLPNGNGIAADFTQVIKQDNPLDFIQTHLTFGSHESSSPSPQGDSQQKEWVIFGPGLNTLHAIKSGWENETTTPQRLAHYVRILQTPMSQMHLGTDMDQGAAIIPISPSLRQLLEQNRGALEAAGLMPQLQAKTASFHPRQRDRLEALLSQQGFARPLFQRHAVRLLQLNETYQYPMVWMVYSRATGEFSAALRYYIADYVARYLARHPEQSKAMAQQAAEQQLRQHLTVVTIGNSDRLWPDGPAYVHYSALSDRPEGGTDPLTQDFGVHKYAPDGAGKDAVFLHVDGLFSGFDAHNFGASGAVNLKLVMDLNQCQTYRQLWEKAQAGALQRPTYEQIAAQVTLTDGAGWLWDERSAWNGVHLPSRHEATQILSRR